MDSSPSRLGRRRVSTQKYHQKCTDDMHAKVAVDTYRMVSL